MGREASATIVDGTLRAVVAAERSAPPDGMEEEALLHRRLTVFFGLVKDATISTDVKLTNEKAIAGTPSYMAPEAITAPETIGPPADSDALGCLAYFLLAGRAPFLGRNMG